MLTKLFIILFVPSRWEIVDKKEVQFSERRSDSSEWLKHQGTQYTLKNQYGDLKFKTILTHGETC